MAPPRRCNGPRRRAEQEPCRRQRHAQQRLAPRLLLALVASVAGAQSVPFLASRAWDCYVLTRIGGRRGPVLPRAGTQAPTPTRLSGWTRSLPPPTGGRGIVVGRRALTEAEAGKIDGTPDELFYLMPRVGIHHTDDGFRAQLSQLYRVLFKPGADLLDLCSQHDSHLPADVEYGSLTAHGMNYIELLANARATERFTQNFNADPSLSRLEDASLDAVTMAVSIQYMQRPTELLKEVYRVLRPDGVVVISFSNRMFFTKAVEVWKSQSSMRGLASLVKGYLTDAGFPAVRVVNGVRMADGSTPNPNGDPFIAAIGFRNASASDRASELPGVSWLVERGAGSIW